jgi:hypothetical protein
MHIRAHLKILAVALVSCFLVFAGAAFGPGIAGAAPSSVVFTDAPGTSAPPQALGPYRMTAFQQDPQGNGAGVSGVTGPTGALGFSPELLHCMTGGCWATWSNGYGGDIYATGGQTITITLPSSTKAFYFYAEPFQFQTFNITATSSDGTTSGAVPVAGLAGAEYFGFYATGSATLSAITVTAADPAGFAVGEFGISDGLIHYTVNSEAWIPFASVVDPLFAFSLPYLTTIDPVEESLDPNCYKPPLAKWPTTVVSSTYGGDGHTAFGAGTYRLRTEISFDFDLSNRKITNFTQDSVPAFGASRRTKVYTSRGKVLDTCTQAGNTTNTQVAQQTSATDFSLGYSGKNPLSQPAALTASAHALIKGTVAADGSLRLSYTTTDFPSHGIQVSVNRNPVTTDIENDVSCLKPAQVLGVAAVARLLFGLKATETGAVTIEPSGSMTETKQSPLC